MKSKKPLVFLGTRTSIDFVTDIAKRNGYEILGILDDEYASQAGDCYAHTDIPILGSELDLDPARGRRDIADLAHTADFFVLSIFMGPNRSDCIKRTRLFAHADKHQLNLANLIDPDSRIFPDVKLGRNILIGYNSFVITGSSIGTGSSLMTFAVLCDGVKIGYNTMIGPFSFLASDTVIGDNCTLGIRTTIARTLRPVSVGNNCIISNSGTIYRSIADNKWLLPNGRMVDNVDGSVELSDDIAYVDTTFVTKPASNHKNSHS